MAKKRKKLKTGWNYVGVDVSQTSPDEPDSRIGKDEVASPSHYNQGKIEVIEFLEDQRLPFDLSNVIKYVCRSGKKDATLAGELKDLKKAAWYLARRVELITAAIENREPVRPNEMMEPRK